MGNRIYMRAVQRAADIAGGVTPLAMYLEAPPPLVTFWINGTSEVPPRVLLKIVEIIIDYDGSRVRGAIPPSLVDVFKERQAANR
jgi:DNA-binding transcriptional regulator YdaS (Cro superfamily)